MYDCNSLSHARWENKLPELHEAKIRRYMREQEIRIKDFDQRHFDFD